MVVVVVVVLLLLLWTSQSTGLNAVVGSGSGTAAASQQGVRAKHSSRSQTGGMPLCDTSVDRNVSTAEVYT